MRVRLAAIATGGTWGRIAAWVAAGLAAAGIEVELLRAGGEVPERLLALDRGEADVSVTTTFGARAAAAGLPPYDRRIDVLGIAELQYPLHWFVPLLRADLGLADLADVARGQPPLRLCLPAPDMLVAAPVRAVCACAGFDPYRDLPRWGGQVLTDFNAVPRLIAAGEADGVFRENSPLRYDASRTRAMRVLGLSEDAEREVAARLGLRAATIPAGTYGGQSEDVRAFDAEGFSLVARSGLADGVAERVARAVDRNTSTHYLGTSIFYSVRFAPATGAPLHPGAAAYYRAQGYAP